ncbi:MAG: 2-C-methyl-D-erythritol 4-phosphate cytidylyltransferase [Candidatus Malihini olakiniferum]
MSELLLSLPEVVAVLPAAGSGSRMECNCPKQYLILHGKTLLEHTLAALFQHPHIQRAVVVISPDDWHFASLPLALDPRVSVVFGGKQRADSVLACLRAVSDAPWVLVHDAARPCLHIQDLDRLLQLIRHCDVGGILAAPVRDTIKRSQGDAIKHTIDRRDLWHALTPQLFPRILLQDCLERALQQGAVVTDEASALEHCGYHPQIVSGRADNIKVTCPEDLALAELYLARLAHPNA